MKEHGGGGGRAEGTCARSARPDAEFTKNRKPGFAPLPRSLVDELVRRTKCRAKTRPLVYVPSHTSRDLDKDLAAVGIPKRTEAGVVDFHGSRNSFATLLLEIGANPSEAQALMRHSDPRITMGIYAKAREPRLGELAEELGNMLLGPGSEETAPGRESAVSSPSPRFSEDGRNDATTRRVGGCEDDPTDVENGSDGGRFRHSPRRRPKGANPLY